MPTQQQQLNDETLTPLRITWAVAVVAVSAAVWLTTLSLKASSNSEGLGVLSEKVDLMEKDRTQKREVILEKLNTMQTDINWIKSEMSKRR